MPDVTPTDSIEQLGAEHRAESARAAAEAAPADAAAMAAALTEIAEGTVRLATGAELCGEDGRINLTTSDDDREDRS